MSAKVPIILLTIIAVESKISNVGNRPTTVTPLGAVEGEWRTSFDGRRYASFEGIPYAKPPIGDLRFAEPEPVEPWIGTWNATTISKCPQTHLMAKAMPKKVPAVGEEDCLYLNIYVPDTKPFKNFDVVIHIHGGAYIAGFSNEYVDAKYVMDRDLILVTFNYRLGALGFLSTEDDVVPGNNGLKDQTLALQWVQNNIESFHGNPKSVTLTGFSAGATSVHFHYLSPYSKDLFHRGMSISGTALNPWALRLNPLQIAKKLAKSVGCETSDTKKMVKCLKARPASQIVEHTDDLHGFGPLPYCLFQPVVDKHAKKPFLEDLPENLLKSGKVLDVPWIASFTHEEGLFVSLVLKHHIEKLNREWDEIGPYFLQTDDTSISFQREALRKIKQHYASSGEDLTFDELTKLGTDALMKYGIEKSIELQTAVVTSPIYYYRFGYTGQNSLKQLLTPEDVKGACHGEDMVYFFGGVMIRPLSSNDVKMKNICLDILSTYARDGKPKAANIEWEPTSQNLSYYELNNPEIVELELNTDHADRSLLKRMKILEKSYLLAHIKDEL